MGREGKELHFLPLGLWGNKVPRGQDLERGGFIRPHGQPLSLLPSSPCGTHMPAAASLPACPPAQGPLRTSSSSQCFWIPITICRRPSVEQTSWGTCGIRHRMSLGERLVLAGSPIQLLEVALSGQLVLMGPRPRCPCGRPLAPGLPPSILTPLPGLHCFRACPRPKGKVPGSDGCPEPPRCFGECAWHRGWRTSGSWW